jgi:hypothetical protein
MEQGDAVPGVALVISGSEGVLAGFGIHAPSNGAEVRLAYTLVWIEPDGCWTEDEETVAARLSAAMDSPAGEPDAGRLRAALELLAEPVRARLAGARERRWAAAEGGAPARVVAGKLQDAIRAAARRRDLIELDRLERALGFVAGGHTAGERMLLEELAERRAAAIARASLGLPSPAPRWGPVEARLEGLLLFATERSVL